MSYLVLVNAKAGTVRDRGRAALEAELVSTFKEGERDADVRMIRPRDFQKEIRAALGRKSQPGTIVIGGGDGSLSSAASLLGGTKTALGILPLGTMNLMARALGVPLEPAEAVRALLESEPVKIDLVDINGHCVLMHASIGLQPRIIRARDALPYKTRFTRLTNGLIAWARAIRKLEPLLITGETDNGPIECLTCAMLISNNALPDGFAEPPVSHDMAGGEIGVYVTNSTRRRDMVALSLATSLGVWRHSELVEEIRTRKLDIDANKKSLLLSVDGEVVKVDTPLKCRLRPRCLKLMVPLVGNAQN